MESWKKGHGDLLDEITKICNRIGGDISAEINEAAFTRISNEELKSLRESSIQAGKLGEHNAQLVDELEKARRTAERVEGLEKENKRLALELEAALRERRADTTHVSIPRSSAPATSTPVMIPMGSARKGGVEDGRTVPWDQYRWIVEKYNGLCQSYLDLKGAKEKLEGLVREKKKMLEEWNEWKEKQEGVVRKKDRKLERLGDELERLKEQLGALEEQTSGNPSPAPTHRERKPSALTSVRQEAVMNRIEKEDKQEKERLEAIQQQHPGQYTTHESTKRSRLPYNVSPTVESALDTRSYHGAEQNDLESIESVLDHSDFRNLQRSVEGQVGPHNTGSTQEDCSPLVPRKSGAWRDDVMVKEEPDSSPVLISSLRVSKRKGRHELDEHTSTVKVKEEQIEMISSSPLGLAGLSYFNDSIDLDDIGEKQDTPRKQRPNAPYLHTPAAERTTHITPDRRINSILQPRSTNATILPRTSVERVRKRQRTAKDNDIAGIIEDGELDRERQRRQSSELDDRLFKLLEKPSPTRTAIIGPVPPASRRTRIGSGLAREVQSSSDEEDMSLPQQRPHARSGTPSRPSSKGFTANSIQNSRLASERSSRSSVEPTRPTSKGSGASLDTSVPPSRRGVLEYKKRGRGPAESDFFSKSSPRAGLQSTTKLAARNSVGSANSSPRRWPYKIEEDMVIDPDEEPLRCRPVEKLTVHDFRINPNYNQGYNYAFTEVVRGVEARKCLQGCLKPECCGKQFRVLAEMSRNNRIRPTSSQEEEDQKLMEKYMGDNAYKLQNMSEDEKWEILMQALTRDLSNKHGNHRHAYERKASPPGFWRTDFPTTQEHQEDRQRAREKEREAVKERYMEAMRPGGAYLFRDE